MRVKDDDINDCDNVDQKSKPVFCPECHAQFMGMDKIHISQDRKVAKRCWNCGSALNICKTEWYYYAEVVVARQQQNVKKRRQRGVPEYKHRECPETQIFIREVESMGPKMALKRCMKLNPNIRKSVQLELWGLG